MPPKKNVPLPAAKKKVVADATFGMKNKKGKKGQEIAQNVQHSGSKLEKQKADASSARKADKQAKWEKEQEMALLFKKVEEKQKPQVAPLGVNPKSVLCIYFKKGFCQEGEKCKFAHDFEVENKAATKDMYTDTRETASNIELGDMKDWDENTLRQILRKKELGRPVNASAQVCKHFVAAIEANRWGWFWECPNGNTKCIYRHALPPDYVLKKDKKKDAIETRSLEAVLEEERANLTGTGVKVTPETFAAWKEKIRKQKEKDAKKAGQQRQQELKSGKARMTGREIMESGSSNYQEDSGSDDGIDIAKLKKEKEAQETAMDEENAKIAAELAKEVEEEFQRDAAESKNNKIEIYGEELPKEILTHNGNVITNKSNNVNNNNNNNNNNNTNTTSNSTPIVLAGVDVSLFGAEEGAEIEDVEFSDDEDEKK